MKYVVWYFQVNVIDIYMWELGTKIIWCLYVFMRCSNRYSTKSIVKTENRFMNKILDKQSQ